MQHHNSVQRRAQGPSRPVLAAPRQLGTVDFAPQTLLSRCRHPPQKKPIADETQNLDVTYFPSHHLEIVTDGVSHRKFNNSSITITSGAHSRFPAVIRNSNFLTAPGRLLFAAACRANLWHDSLARLIDATISWPTHLQAGSLLKQQLARAVDLRIRKTT